MTYTKLFKDILDSTIWRESNETRLVWITMLAMSDKYGDVHSSIPGLADRAKVSIEECEQALECLQSPDKYSRTSDFEGRRIEPIEGGWNLLNHGKYRQRMNQEERREYNRVKQAEYRARQKAKASKSVSNGEQMSAVSAHTDTDTDKEAGKDASHPPPTRRVAWSENDGFTGLIDSDWDRWKESCPAVDLKSEVARASEWLLANPAKKKKQPYRFLSNWLRRAQERGGSAPSNPTHGRQTNSSRTQDRNAGTFNDPSIYED